MLHDGLLHEYSQIGGRTTWFQQTNNATTTVPSDALFYTVRKFGSTIYCKAPIAHLQGAIQHKMDQTSQMQETFTEYFKKQPEHIKHIQDNFCTSEVDPNY
eukprot:5021154-Ditylum_brightwellii.AAC.1